MKITGFCLQNIEQRSVLFYQKLFTVVESSRWWTINQKFHSVFPCQLKDWNFWQSQHARSNNFDWNIFYNSRRKETQIRRWKRFLYKCNKDVLISKSELCEKIISSQISYGKCLTDLRTLSIALSKKITGFQEKSESKSFKLLWSAHFKIQELLCLRSMYQALQEIERTYLLKQSKCTCWAADTS